MRLINIHTLELEEFFKPPSYAILSHRWIGREITYEQYIDPAQRHGLGYEKIARFCALLREGQDAFDFRVDWAWVDTCCIDKRSSAELSESINSMWQWYWNADFCVAWLHDVQSRNQLQGSEWLTRGWTLQELLAPWDICFFDGIWRFLGSRMDLAWDLSLATTIPLRYMQSGGRNFIERAGVAQRMSWASARNTTRPEDEAYCLFGLFGINLPLLYGEGGFKAFIRLQEEIVRSSNDESIFAWRWRGGHLLGQTGRTGLLASSPVEFSDSGQVFVSPSERRRPFSVTNNGIQITCKLAPVQWHQGDFLRHGFLLLLNCVERNDKTKTDARCLLLLVPGENGIYSRQMVESKERREVVESAAQRTTYLESDQEETIYVYKDHVTCQRAETNTYTEIYDNKHHIASVVLY